MKSKLLDYMPLAAIAAGVLLIRKKQGVSGIGLGSRYTIQEIFELRKEGLYKEAYFAAKQMYSEHAGHYTTLCMFWTAISYADDLVHRGNTVRARVVLNDAIAVYPKIQDVNREGMRSIERIEAKLPHGEYYQPEIMFE